MSDLCIKSNLSYSPPLPPPPPLPLPSPRPLPLAGKAQRLKEAKEEAAKEIEEYRKQRDAQFQEQQQKYAGSKDDFAQKMQVETQKKIQQIEVEVDSNKEAVIQRLLELIYEIKPELHQNVCLQQNAKLQNK